MKIEKDGYTLSSQRTENDGSQLPEALAVAKAWQEGNKQETSFASWVTKKEIAESGDYNLTGERYRVLEAQTSSWSLVELGDVVEILDRLRKPITKSDRIEGRYPYYGATGIVDWIDDYIFDERLVLVGEDGAKWSAGEKTAFVAEGKYWVNNHAHVLRPIKEKISETYLVSMLNFLDLNKYITGVTVPKLNQEKLRSITFPLPPIEVQREIVAELDRYQKIIDGARQVVENYKPSFRINSDWEHVAIGDIAKVQGGYAFSSKDMKAQSGAQVIKIGNVKDRRFDPQNNPSYMESEALKTHSGFKLKIGDILISMTGTAGKRDYGNVCKVDVKGDFLLNQRVGRVVPNSKILGDFLYVTLNQESVKNDFFKSTTGGVRQGNISNKQIESIKIALPDITEQKKIIALIKTEQDIVDSNMHIATVFEQKIKDKITEVWGE